MDYKRHIVKLTEDELKEEQWKENPKNPVMEVSTMGRIRWKDTKYIVQQWTIKNGYAVTKTNYQYWEIHTQVAETYLNYKADSNIIYNEKRQKPKVIHKDGNKLNNKLSNLKRI